MEIDERVAKLKLERRKAKENEKVQDEIDTIEEVSLEDTITQMKNGSVKVGEKDLKFTKNKYLNGKVQVFLPDEYLKQQHNSLNGAVFVNELTGVSFTLNYMQNPGKKQNFQQFKLGMQQGFKQQMGLYMEWLEEDDEVKIGDITVYYGIYKAPTGKGNTYNLIFYIQKGKSLILGNYNCFEKDIKDWIMIMKATVHLIEINV